MCNIWKEESCRELTVSEIEKWVEAPFLLKLRCVHLTGGEPFLRKDLPEIACVFGELPSLEAIQIATNGMMTSQIMGSVEKMLKHLPSSVFFSVSLSIDGDEPIHDQIRGIKGVYRLTTETLRQLQAMNDPRLSVGVQATVSQANIHSIETVYGHLKGIADHVGFYPAICSDSFYGNQSSRAVEKDAEYIKKAVQFFSILRDEESEHAFLYDQTRRFLEVGVRSLECLAGQKTAYLSTNGELFPCLMLEDKKEFCFGSVIDGKAMDSWRNSKGTFIRKGLKNNSVCSGCSLSCDLVNNLNEEFFQIMSFYLKNPLVFIKLLKSSRLKKIKIKNLS